MRDYGKLLVYNFPKSRLIWASIEARTIRTLSCLDSSPCGISKVHSYPRSSTWIPIGKSLLYVERSICSRHKPDAELRLVVVALKKLGYGLSFTEAMTSLLGQAMTSSTSASEEKKRRSKTEQTAAPQQSPLRQPHRILGSWLRRLSGI
jgi:uncharacterized membrane protein (UPF0182 family)